MLVVTKMKSLFSLIGGTYYEHVTNIVARIRAEGSTTKDQNPTSTTRIQNQSLIYYYFWAYYTVCLCISARFAITGYFLAIKDETYFRYDIYFALLNKERFYEGFFFVTAAGLNIFGALMHYVLYYRPDVRIWLRIHDLVVRNRDQFLKHNPHLQWDARIGLLSAILTPLESGKRVLHIGGCLWSGRGVRFGPQARLVYFQNFPAKVRARVMLIVWIFEVFYAVAMAIFGKLAFLLYN